MRGNRDAGRAQPPGRSVPERTVRCEIPILGSHTPFFGHFAPETSTSFWCEMRLLPPADTTHSV
jgi:hypothetical protein